MTTVGELMEELGRFPRHALISVRVTPETACTVAMDSGDFEVDDVEPNGCNIYDVRIHLGGER